MFKHIEADANYINYFKEINELLDEFLNITEDDLINFNSSKKLIDHIPQSHETMLYSAKINNLLTLFDNFDQKIKLQNPNNLLVKRFVFVLILIRPKLRSFYKDLFQFNDLSNYRNFLNRKIGK